ncbi:MAG: UDP-4-amino-4,6-dideoxy-N-acetyl-beta-L-altrosamine transaminase [Flavobacteriales bacterium]|nr:UDP-4-amino-4,6-dideoxy-N-acetyl-beta-L-altrosamine transaminase [Flavobacteriales bacterium]
MKTIPYGRQHITPEDIEAVNKVLQSDYLTQGPAVAEFEQAFADYVEAKYAVAVTNGTAALHLAALALNVHSGTRVITTPITFAASANCIRYCGGEVFFADVEPETFLLDPIEVIRLIASKPKGYFHGIIPVDLAGNPCNLDHFRKIADEHGLWIIEDACHAPGAWFTDATKKIQKCGNGNFADMSVFSFHPVKHIATGEGGMITTNDEKLYRKLLQLRTHGITRDPELMKENHGGWYYEMQELGYNYRMPDILAALGTSQLKRADEGMKRRIEIAARYDRELDGLPIKLPKHDKHFRHAYHLYIIRTKKRKELYDFLKENQILCQVHYIPVHLMPYYREIGHKPGEFPFAESYYEQCLSLPMFPSLTDEEQAYVIGKMKEFFQK